MLGFSIMWTKNVQMSKLGLEKEEEPEIKLPTITGIIEKVRELQKNMYLCFIDYAIDSSVSLPIWIITNSGKLLKRWEYQTRLPVSWDIHIQVKKQQLETCMEQQLGSRLRKQYDRAICCHPVCLAYRLSTSWEMPGWMSYKLESR